MSRPDLHLAATDTATADGLNAAPGGPARYPRTGRSVTSQTVRLDVLVETKLDAPRVRVSLDQGDNDPSRLRWHVAAALQRGGPAISAGNLLAGLRAQSRDFAGTVLPLLFNELA